MEIRPVADVPSLTSWVAVTGASLAADHALLPVDPIEEYLPLLDPPRPESGEQTLLRLALVDGRPVGSVQLDLPTLDNLATCSVYLHIHPEHRRRGYGRELLTHALAECAGLGRTIILFEVPSPYPDGPGPGEPLLRSVGGRPVLYEIRRVLDQATVRLPGVDTGGYRLVSWSDIAPDDLVEGLARLAARMSTDAPMGDMTYEPEVWAPERYRAQEAMVQAKSRHRFATAVLAADGEVVGMTDIGVSRGRPEVGYQWETIVDPAHRGHRLGLALKVRNHARLRELLPACRWVNTWNAESNTPMVAVNEALGFTPVDRWTEWQIG